MPTNVGTATLRQGGYYMRGGVIAKGALIYIPVETVLLGTSWGPEQLLSISDMTSP
jgi:hypothetical protein